MKIRYLGIFILGFLLFSCGTPPAGWEGGSGGNGNGDGNGNGGGEVDCDALTTELIDATTAWTDALMGGDSDTECAAMVAAYQAGLDGGCAGYDQAGLEAMEASCGAGGGTSDCDNLSFAYTDAYDWYIYSYEYDYYTGGGWYDYELCLTMAAAYLDALDAGCSGFSESGYNNIDCY